MKYYFLSELSAEEHQLLEDREIEHDLWKVDQTLGVLIAESLLERAKDVLQIDTFESYESDYEDIFPLDFERRRSASFQPPSKVINTSRFTSHLPKGLVDIVRDVLAPYVDREMVLTGPHGKSFPAIEDGRFYIHCFAGCEGSYYQESSSLLWGISGMNASFSPTRDGCVVRDSNGTCVGELVNESNLYLFYDYTSLPPGAFKVLMKRSLEEVVVWLTMDDVERASLEAGHPNTAHGEVFETYFRTIMRGINKSCADLIEQNNTFRRETEVAYCQYIERAHQLQANEKLLQSAKAALESERERVYDEFRKLVALPKIRKVESTGRKLIFFTEVLHCKDSHKRAHEIGAFRIELDLSEAEVSWFNLTRRVDGHSENMNAPHIYSNGQACLGNAEMMFAELWGRWDIAEIVLLAIRFVETVNESDSAGRHIRNWPLAA